MKNQNMNKFLYTNLSAFIIYWLNLKIGYKINLLEHMNKW